MNKKGALFWYTILAGLVLVVGMAMFITPEPAVNYIGEKPLKIIHTSLQFEKLLHYIDQSAKFSSYKSIYDLSNKGGFAENEKCGKSLDYNLWNNKDKKIEDCFPDYENNFKLIFDKYLTKYLDNHPDYLVSVNYNYLLSKKDKLKIIGIAEEDANTAVKALTRRLPELIPWNYEPSKDEKEGIKIIKEKYSSEIISAINNLPPDAPKPSESLIGALIMAESLGEEKAISPTGCRGLTQVCYSTAQDYIRIFEFLTPCDCNGELCKTKPKCNDENDARGDAHKSIIFIVTYVSNLMKIFKDSTYKEEFTIAAYNGGYVVIKNVIKKTGKKDPTWAEVSDEITPDLITYFKTLKERENKVVETKKYVPKVVSYKRVYGGAKAGSSEMTAAAIVILKLGAPRESFVGVYSLKPNFKVELDFDLAVFDKTKEQAKELIEECSGKINEELKVCILVKLGEMNKANSNKPKWDAMDIIGTPITKRTFKFNVDTNKQLFPFEENVVVKFALYFPEPT